MSSITLAFICTGDNACDGLGNAVVVLMIIAVMAAISLLIAIIFGIKLLLSKKKGSKKLVGALIIGISVALILYVVIGSWISQNPGRVPGF